MDLQVVLPYRSASAELSIYKQRGQQKQEKKRKKRNNKVEKNPV